MFFSMEQMGCLFLAAIDYWLLLSQAETTEDLNEWKAALDEALANAPSASPMAGQSGTVKNEKGDTADGSSEQCKNNTLKNYLFIHLYCYSIMRDFPFLVISRPCLYSSNNKRSIPAKINGPWSSNLDCIGRCRWNPFFLGESP